MHVVTNSTEVAIATSVHEQGLVATAKQVTCQLIAPVESPGVYPKKPLHAFNEICLWSFKHQVKMVFHEAKSMDLPLGLDAGLAKRSNESLSVFVIAENCLAMITPIHHVV